MVLAILIWQRSMFLLCWINNSLMLIKQKKSICQGLRTTPCPPMNSNMLVFLFFFFWTSKWEQVSCKLLAYFEPKVVHRFFFFFNVRHMPLLLLGLRAYRQLQVIWINYPRFWSKRERPVLIWPFTLLPYMCMCCLFSTNVQAGWAPSQH